MTAGARMLFWALALIAAPIAGRASPAAWVQMTETGAEARLVAPGPCPTARVDGRRRPMVERAGPTEGFDNHVCAVRLNPKDRQVDLAGALLRAPKARPERIVILGDSGCRLKGSAFQHCNDPTGWPFARIAALAAARAPDLVIHVGDYYYRETACPTGNAGCAGSPYGDRWATWKAELFDPAAPLLAAAPWIFARGNHEDCKRGGAGWFRQLDAAETPKACPSESESWAVDIGGTKVLVVDSADTEDLTAPADKVAAFTARLGPLRQMKGEPVWVLTHRPVWNSSRLGDLLADGVVNATEREAVKSADLAPVTLFLSGHVHNFTSVGFGPARPPQLVVGTGGDSLDLDDAPPPAFGKAVIDGLESNIFTMGRWGYFVFDRRGPEWIGRFYDTHDRVATVCRLTGRDLSCHTPKS